MANIPESTHDEIKKNVFPEGGALATDRGIDAKKQFNISDVKAYEEWRKDHSKSDLKGYDDRASKEPSAREIAKKISGGKSGEDVLFDEADRFSDPTSEAGRLLRKYKNNIYDFETFKQVVKQAWDVPGESIKNLYDNISKKNLDAVLKPLFDTKQVQKWLKDNNMSEMIARIRKRYKVEPERARKIYERLTPSGKERLLKIVSGKPIRIKEAPVKAPKKRVYGRIKQVSASGKSYFRSKPRKFTDNQILFLKARRGLPIARILETYNREFKEDRTKSSLQNKLYRLNPR